MIKIKPHKYPKASSEYYKEETNFLLSLIERSKNRLVENKRVSLYSLYSTNYLSIIRYKIIENNTSGISKHLHSALDFGLSHFQRMEGKVPYLYIEGQQFENHKVDLSKSTIKLVDWETGVILFSMLVRDYPRREEILAFDPYPLFENEGGFEYSTRFYHAILTGNKNLIEEYKKKDDEFIEKGETKYFTKEGSYFAYNASAKEQAEKIVQPKVHMAYAAFHKDSSRFNEILEKYLIDKKTWIKKSRNSDNPQYYIDFNALCICAYAYDQGIDIQVESEYIPAWVYRGEFE